MLAAGVAPNSYTYTVLIKGLTTDPNFFEDAKKCLLEMMDKGKRPNVATYIAVIEAFARQLRRRDMSNGLRLASELSCRAVDVEPESSFVVSIAWKSYILSTASDTAAKVPHARRTNAATYTTVIEGFARQEGRVAEDEGKEFVEVMMGKGLIVPNAKAMREVLKGKPTSVIRRVMNIVLSKLKG
ncbi:pentatricopeptide repeat-containing protein At4g26800-like [Rosa rugosa]|uniref:pentatricopeptide repeat-containing protein At4g26800-like n=1 Tax=Rosa rugosa TaxID=74645 RepID=UPI002B411654|nr:pentatricopeptide repeat-containing protein At4g26800-like [Rosa rugosa]